MHYTEMIASLLRKIPRRVISLIFLACVVVFFALYLRSIDWQRLSHLHFSWGYLVAATVSATVSRYWGVLIWRYILRDLGATDLPDFVTMADVYAKSWLGRYIPGTVTWIAGKVYMASAHRISKSRLAVSSLLEGGTQILDEHASFAQDVGKEIEHNNIASLVAQFHVVATLTHQS